MVKVKVKKIIEFEISCSVLNRIPETEKEKEQIKELVKELHEMLNLESDESHNT
ncbi:hypothetical protein SDC9_115802 [bioreactor metagenome]|uniref:Uncharacterized protein n=1 Tax=bioreactor metagenome TaxID=1076179 RepID=A0A645BUJ0_9ZZZZ